MDLGTQLRQVTVLIELLDFTKLLDFTVNREPELALSYLTVAILVGATYTDPMERFKPYQAAHSAAAKLGLIITI